MGVLERCAFVLEQLIARLPVKESCKKTLVVMHSVLLKLLYSKLDSKKLLFVLMYASVSEPFALHDVQHDLPQLLYTECRA